MLVTLGIKGKSGIGIVKYLALDTLRLEFWWTGDLTAGARTTNISTLCGTFIM